MSMHRIVPWIFFFLICSASAQQFRVRTEEKTVANQLKIRRVFVETDAGKYTLLIPAEYQMSNIAKNRMLYFSNTGLQSQMTITWHRFTEEESSQIKALSATAIKDAVSSSGAGSGQEGAPVGNTLFVKPEEASERENKGPDSKAIEVFYRSKILQQYPDARVTEQFAARADKHSGPGFVVERFKPARSITRYAYIPMNGEILMATLVASPDNAARVKDALANLLMTVVAVGKNEKLDVPVVPGEI